MRRKWLALLGSLSLSLLVVSACGSSGPAPATPVSPEKLEAVVGKWVDENVADLAETIGKLATGDLPLARDVVAEAVTRALQANLEWQIIEQTTTEKTGERTARVRLMFPLKLEVSVISREYRVSVDYVLRIVEDRVVDADIDLDSFRK